MSSLALPLRVFEYWLMQYRRVWRGTAITSIVNPVFYLGALGVGLGTLVNKSSGQLPRRLVHRLRGARNARGDGNDDRLR